MRTIVIHHIHPAATENSLADFIKSHNYGDVTASDISLPRNADGAAIGVAFVRFRSDEAASAALRFLGSSAYKGIKLKVRLAYTEFVVAARRQQQSAVTEAPIIFKESPAPEAGPLVDRQGRTPDFYTKMRESWKFLDQKGGTTSADNAVRQVVGDKHKQGKKAA